MIINTNLVERDFYQESEWRYIPRNSNVATHITQNGYQNSDVVAFANAKTKEYCSLKFSAEDVSYIFVPCDSDIPEIIEFMQDKLKSLLSNEQLLILYSRIVSIETLNRDM